jgi:hypothetical protein
MRVIEGSNFFRDKKVTGIKFPLFVLAQMMKQDLPPNRYLAVCCVIDDRTKKTGTQVVISVVP